MKTTMKTNDWMLPDPGWFTGLQLGAALRDIQRVLFVTADGLDPEKPWDADAAMDLAAVMVTHGLAPRSTRPERP